MIGSTKTNAWQTALSTAITDPLELLQILELDLNLLDDAQRAARIFPLKVPRGFVARMQKGNLADPILQQVLPLGVELHESAGFSADPLHESQYNPLPGLLHKYHGRVLLTLIGTCGVNCRYCFRREFPYLENNPGSAGWNKVLAYIAQHDSIEEVILSGGDPLVANDQMLGNLIQALDAIPHVKRVRIHSRMPIVLPERMTAELVAALTQTRLQIILVTHANHPQEINHEVNLALRPLRQAGITLLNQSVLLKGINDRADILIELSRTLFAAGVLPYYLHLLDKVQGAAHFDLNKNTAIQLHQVMASRLSGYLVPKLVTEQPGFPAKSVIASAELYTD